MSNCSLEFLGADEFFVVLQVLLAVLRQCLCSAFLIAYLRFLRSSESLYLGHVVMQVSVVFGNTCFLEHQLPVVSDVLGSPQFRRLVSDGNRVPPAQMRAAVQVEFHP
jgi:hypothetical protein